MKRLQYISYIGLISLSIFFWANTTNVEAAHSFTFATSSSDIFYFDVSDSLVGMYVATEITNATGAAVPHIWAKIEGFSGPSISLATNATDIIHIGQLAAGASTTVFFYVETSALADTAVDETYTISLYGNNADAVASVNVLDSDTFTFTDQDDTIAAASNTVNSTVVNPDPPALGSDFTITVTGDTGVLGSSQIASFTPAALTTWPADSLQLTGTQVTLEYGAGTGDDVVLNNDLVATLASGVDTPYTAVYTFRTVGTTATTSSLNPTGYINSGGTNMKHTGVGDFVSLAPILSVANQLLLSSTASPGAHAGVGTTTYTLLFTNTSATDTVAIDRVVNTLASSPANTTYATGTAMFNGVSIGEPSLSGQTLTWEEAFAVPPSMSRSLTFDVAVPGTTGSYVNSAVAFIGAEQIDTTLNTSHSAPATSTVTVGGSDTTPPTITIAAPTKDVSSVQTITDTTIQVTDVFGVASSSVVVDVSTGVAFNSFVCVQTSGTVVDCTIVITNDGGNDALIIQATDTSANVGTATEGGYDIGGSSSGSGGVTRGSSGRSNRNSRGGITRTSELEVEEETCPHFKKNLVRRDEGDEVTKMQEFLKSLGFFPGLEINGAFGHVTQAAVEGFQRAYAAVVLSSDENARGEWNDETREKANELKPCNEEVQAEPESDVITGAVTLDQGQVRGFSISEDTLVVSLLAQLDRLTEQLLAMGSGHTQMASPVTTARVISENLFTRDLDVEDTGEDVRALQQFLNTHGFVLTTSNEPGASGQETARFGSLTREALRRFQDAHAVDILTPVGLTQGTGVFGPSTRAFINRMLES